MHFICLQQIVFVHFPIYEIETITPILSSWTLKQNKWTDPVGHWRCSQLLYAFESNGIFNRLASACDDHDDDDYQQQRKFSNISKAHLIGSCFRNETIPFKWRNVIWETEVAFLSLIRSMQFPGMNMSPVQRRMDNGFFDAVEIGATDSHLITTKRNCKPHYSRRYPIGMPNTNVSIREVDSMFVVPNKKNRSSLVELTKP